MSTDIACLAIRLQGPLQAWDTDSQFNNRGTDLLPSRSAIMGILCAAKGLSRGSEEEREYLAQCASLHMKVVNVPRLLGNRVLSIRRMEDYHTVMDTPKAGGGTKDCHITRRQYLLDASFFAFLTGDKLVLEEASIALQDPVWGVWLGRKCCVPSAPLFAGLFSTETDALQHCLQYTLDNYVWTEDIEKFSEGNDSVADIPLSFSSHGRQFTLRRVRRHQGSHYAS